MKETAEKTLDTFKLKMEKVRLTVRAGLGLPLEDDNFAGLIHINDLKERTRVTEAQVYAHTYMHLLAASYEEFDIFNDVAELEDTYYIALNGEQRKEALLYKRQEMVMQGQPMQLPQVVTNQSLSEPMQQQEGKKVKVK